MSNSKQSPSVGVDAVVIHDINGIEIKPGQTVRVHQKEGITEGKVVELFPDWPTYQKDGYWVDIERGDGLEEMMSYILEVI